MKRSFSNQDLSPRFSFSINNLNKRKKRNSINIVIIRSKQQSKEERIFLLFHPVLSTDKSIRARKNRPNYPFASPLFRSRLCAVSIPLSPPPSLPRHSRINSKVIRARSSSNKMHRDELASIREELIVCTEANYSEALKFKSISPGSWEQGGGGNGLISFPRPRERGIIFLGGLQSSRRGTNKSALPKWGMAVLLFSLSPRRIRGKRGEGDKYIDTHTRRNDRCPLVN